MPEPASPSDALLSDRGPDDEPATLRARLLTAERDREELRAALAAARSREQLLAHELQHRVRNMLALIRLIFRRTRESGASPDEFPEHFLGRLDTVARYQADLVEFRSGGVDLEDMVRDELLAVQVVDGPEVVIEGTPVRLRGKALELIGLALHELTTNSIKFGALFHAGKLRVDWALAGAPHQQMLRLRWQETSVPLIAPAPRPRGFGLQLIEEALPYQLGATTSFELTPGRLECLIALPLPASEAPRAGSEHLADDEPPFLSSELEQQS